MRQKFQPLHLYALTKADHRDNQKATQKDVFAVTANMSDL
jgi:hypothetical protein